MNPDTPYEVKFNSFKWLNADRMKIEEDHNKIDLQTDRIVAETFRELFMKHNKPWMQEQLYEIFTPRTLFLYRDQILEQFQRVMDNPFLEDGPGGGDATETETEKPDKAEQDSSLDSDIMDADNFEDETKKKKVIASKGDLDWVKANDSPMTRAIIKFWIIRARFRQKARMQVTQLIDYMRKPFCLFCRTTYGLKVELIQNIEDLFYQFLKHKQASVINYKIVDWQRYFVKHASTRTICQDCHREIEIYHQKVKKNLREQERKRLGLQDESITDSDQQDEIMEDEGANVEGRRKRIRLISEGAKAVIRFYIQ